ncbi:MAG: hypothetical protein COB24_08800 [Hyphomicrobiales bacterium]|nr:MAG: hypothetical protein COB24_08800 [Hyphomicrobiales bacterium]
MSVFEDLYQSLSVQVAKFAAHIGIIKQVVEGDDTTDVDDGNGGTLSSFRKIAKDVNSHIPAVLAAVDEAETIINDGTAAVDLLVAEAETIITDGQAAIDESAGNAAASEANILLYGYAAVAAVSGDELHANVFVSPDTLTENLTILENQNAIGLFTSVADGVVVTVLGNLTIIE